MYSKQYPEILISTSKFFSFFNFNDFKRDLPSRVEKNPLFSDMPQKIMASDGRTIAYTDTAEQNWLIFLYGFHITTISSIIEAMLSVINRTSSIFFTDIAEICFHSTLIPEDSCYLWAKGFLLGFESDFYSACHLLIPQLEHAIRIILKKRGVSTIVIKDGTNTEEEKSLSSLINDSELEKVLPENIIKELTYLLIDPCFYNLRNNFAHGLLTEVDRKACIYLWAFCWKLTIASIPKK